MADDEEKTEDFIILNAKRTRPFCYARRYGTEEKSMFDFCVFFEEILNG